MPRGEASVNLLRYQLPAYSPLTLGGIGGAAWAAARRDASAPHLLNGLLAGEYEASRAVLFGSGAQALQAGLEVALRSIGRASLVAIPAYSCFEVASAAVGCGAGLVLYDVDPTNLGPDLDSLRNAVHAGARVIVLAPLFGIPIAWDRVREILVEGGAIGIEDAAQGHGASWWGAPLGTLGELSVLSFGRGKGWCGVRGGALLLRGDSDTADPDPRAADGRDLEEARIGFAALAQWALGRPELYRLPRSIPGLGLGETVYRQPSPPRAITRSAAALILRSFAVSLEEAVLRRANAAELRERLPPNPHLEPFRIPAGSQPGYLRFPLRMRRGMAGFPFDPRPLGIACGYPATLASLPAVQRRLEREPASFKGAEELVRTLVTLPTHSGITPRERERMLHLLGRYGS
jgi:perosamine synthetase